MFLATIAVCAITLATLSAHLAHAAPTSSGGADLVSRGSGWNESHTLDQLHATSEFLTPTSWAAGGNRNFTAHESCNVTQNRLIGEGLDEALVLLNHARAHIRRFGNDTIFTDWFGEEADPNTALGLYDRLVDGDKTGLTFRCDDVGSLCNSTYGVIPGYFLPSDHDTTVICPTYYLKKPELQDMCTQGRTLFSSGTERASSDLPSNNATEITQGAWFVHRLLHTNKGAGGRLSDVVDSAEEALELAKGVNKTQALYSIHTVQYFALDTYATDILLPGEGCRGTNATTSS